MIQQVQLPIGNMPINLILLSNGTLAFVRVGDFEALFDQHGVPGGVDATFYEADFTINGETFSYNTAYEYKQFPDMLLWIQQQKLQSPFANA